MNDTLQGPQILSAIKANGIEVVVSVPDIVTSEGLLRPISTDPGLRHINANQDVVDVVCSAPCLPAFDVRQNPPNHPLSTRRITL